MEQRPPPVDNRPTGKFVCIGCGSECSGVWALATIEENLLLACTPICLYEGVRKWVERDHSLHVDAALVGLLTKDLLDELRKFVEADTLEMDWPTKRSLIGSWERLEAALGQITLDAEHPAADLDPRWAD
jgi:hypothetical protein